GRGLSEPALRPPIARRTWMSVRMPRAMRACESVVFSALALRAAAWTCSGVAQPFWTTIAARLGAGAGTGAAASSLGAAISLLLLSPSRSRRLPIGGAVPVGDANAGRRFEGKRRRVNKDAP